MSKSTAHRVTAARMAELLGLNRAPRLKQALKSMIDTLQDPLGRGVPLLVGGVEIRVPPRFARAPWVNYETISATQAAQWLAIRPDACFLDIGCSVGIYSLLTLAVAPRGTAYAFDSDLVSLKVTLRLCRHVGAERLRLIYGFIADKSQSASELGAAARETDLLISRPEVASDPGRTSFVCLDGQERPGIPVHSLDRLFPDADSSRPWLLKCDVEGAEMLVLQGADQFVRRARPQMLISVHDALAGFGFSKADLARWIEDRGYTRRILAVDHEEHWWCDPPAASAN